jgi:hypothetical protein
MWGESGVKSKSTKKAVAVLLGIDTVCDFCLS